MFTDDLSNTLVGNTLTAKDRDKTANASAK